MEKQLLSHRRRVSQDDLSRQRRSLNPSKHPSPPEIPFEAQRQL
jgi:hypothetical protein